MQQSITISDTALHHFKAQLAEHRDMAGLRLTIKKTGCSGLSYVFELLKEIHPSDQLIANSDNLPLYLDSAYSDVLQGLKVDLIKEGLNRKLAFENPNETGRCGCGESFTVK